MQAGSVALIERNVDRTASALFAAAAGYAAYAALAWHQAQRLSALEAAAAAALAYWLCLRTLTAVQPRKRRLPVAVFDVREIEEAEAPELLLTETWHSPAPAQAEPLVLDDILAELEPDSRVVRLFDPAAMPTPGQFSDRIERHLAGGSPPAAPEDASQALHDALAELRRSLPNLR